MYESVYGWVACSMFTRGSFYVCLKERLAALAVAASVLHAGRSVVLVRLLRREDHLLQAVTLLVGAAVLHLRHRLLHVSKPRIRHFV